MMFRKAVRVVGLLGPGRVLPRRFASIKDEFFADADQPPKEAVFREGQPVTSQKTPVKGFTNNIRSGIQGSQSPEEFLKAIGNISVSSLTPSSIVPIVNTMIGCLRYATREDFKSFIDNPKLIELFAFIYGPINKKGNTMYLPKALILLHIIKLKSSLYKNLLPATFSQTWLHEAWEVVYGAVQEGLVDLRDLITLTEHALAHPNLKLYELAISQIAKKIEHQTSPTFRLELSFVVKLLKGMEKAFHIHTDTHTAIIKSIFAKGYWKSLDFYSKVVGLKTLIGMNEIGFYQIEEELWTALEDVRATLRSITLNERDIYAVSDLLLSAECAPYCNFLINEFFVQVCQILKSKKEITIDVLHRNLLQILYLFETKQVSFVLPEINKREIFTFYTTMPFGESSSPDPFIYNFSDLNFLMLAANHESVNLAIQPIISHYIKHCVKVERFTHLCQHLNRPDLEAYLRHTDSWELCLDSLRRRALIKTQAGIPLNARDQAVFSNFAEEFWDIPMDIKMDFRALKLLKSSQFPFEKLSTAKSMYLHSLDPSLTFHDLIRIGNERLDPEAKVTSLFTRGFGYQPLNTNYLIMLMNHVISSNSQDEENILLFIHRGITNSFCLQSHFRNLDFEKLYSVATLLGPKALQTFFSQSKRPIKIMTILFLRKALVPQIWKRSACDLMRCIESALASTPHGLKDLSLIVADLTRQLTPFFTQENAKIFGFRKNLQRTIFLRHFYPAEFADKQDLAPQINTRFEQLRSNLESDDLSTEQMRELIVSTTSQTLDRLEKTLEKIGTLPKAATRNFLPLSLLIQSQYPPSVNFKPLWSQITEANILNSAQEFGLLMFLLAHVFPNINSPRKLMWILYKPAQQIVIRAPWLDQIDLGIFYLAIKKWYLYTDNFMGSVRYVVAKEKELGFAFNTGFHCGQIQEPELIEALAKLAKQETVSVQVMTELFIIAHNIKRPHINQLLDFLMTRSDDIRAKPSCSQKLPEALHFWLEHHHPAHAKVWKQVLEREASQGRLKQGDQWALQLKDATPHRQEDFQLCPEAQSLVPLFRNTPTGTYLMESHIVAWQRDPLVKFYFEVLKCLKFNPPIEIICLPFFLIKPSATVIDQLKLQNISVTNFEKSEMPNRPRSGSPSAPQNSFRPGPSVFQGQGTFGKPPTKN